MFIGYTGLQVCKVEVVHVFVRHIISLFRNIEILPAMHCWTARLTHSLLIAWRTCVLLENLCSSHNGYRRAHMPPCNWAGPNEPCTEKCHVLCPYHEAYRDNDSRFTLDCWLPPSYWTYQRMPGWQESYASPGLHAQTSISDSDSPKPQTSFTSKTSIQYTVSAPMLRQYIRNRNNWSHETMVQVDWDAQGASIAQECIPKTHIIKLVHNFLPMNHQVSKYSALRQGKCPCCDYPVEASTMIFGAPLKAMLTSSWSTSDPCYHISFLIVFLFMGCDALDLYKYPATSSNNRSRLNGIRFSVDGSVKNGLKLSFRIYIHKQDTYMSSLDGIGDNTNLVWMVSDLGC